MILSLRGALGSYQCGLLHSPPQGPYVGSWWWGRGAVVVVQLYIFKKLCLKITLSLLLLSFENKQTKIALILRGEFLDHL